MDEILLFLVLENITEFLLATVAPASSNVLLDVGSFTGWQICSVFKRKPFLPFCTLKNKKTFSLIACNYHS